MASRRRERQHRGHQRIAQLAGDGGGSGRSHNRMAAEHRVRSALLGSTVEDDDGGLALLMNGGIDFGISHQLDFHGLSPTQ